MKVTDLAAGARLDYWVARSVIQRRLIAIVENECRVMSDDMTGYKAFSPSQDQTDGEFLIERFGITTHQEPGSGNWRAFMVDDQSGETFQADGDTRLVAAMRTLLLAKNGPDVSD